MLHNPNVMISARGISMYIDTHPTPLLKFLLRQRVPVCFVFTNHSMKWSYGSVLRRCKYTNTPWRVINTKQLEDFP